MSNQHHCQHSRAHRDFSKIQTFYTANHPKKVGTGIFVAWRKGHPDRVIIKLENGKVFTCFGLSKTQQLGISAITSIMAKGHYVAFYHDGFDISGKPINPTFKTLIILRRGGAK